MGHSTVVIFSVLNSNRKYSNFNFVVSFWLGEAKKMGQVEIIFKAEGWTLEIKKEKSGTEIQTYENFSLKSKFWSIFSIDGGANEILHKFLPKNVSIWDF